ncbi:MAG TPA: phosphomannomutase/phosphoglucomutase [Candidatus Saccharibacteria bacterium]|nr:phosphomannomutase/phosphoglucomutase [Candidatus Saccharibacteria bacterium]
MEFPSHIFKAYDIRGKVGTELSPELCEAIGSACAEWLPTQGIVAVGRDMRPDSAQLADAVIRGLRKQGRAVWDIGEVTSDMIYFAVGAYDLAGGMVVTASHNAGDYNGIKIYRDKVTPVGLDSGLDAIRDLAQANQFTPAENEGSLEQKTITDEWVQHAVAMVQPETWPKFSIAIDAGNGMAGAILPTVLENLPISAERMYFDLDGTFPNHEANPQNPDNLKDLVQTVISNRYDFGIAFDGDGDRAAFVDEKGRPVLGTDLISIVAKLILAKYPGSKIVHDVRTSRATKELVREWGGEPVRTKAGRVYIGALVREVGAQFGGETTGHLFFASNFDADSGLVAALYVMQAIAESGKKLSELVDEYRRYVMPPEINFETTNSKAVIAKLKETYSEAAQDELDGLTVESKAFWFNLRSSNTEPVIRLNIEAETTDILEAELAKIQQIVESTL